MKYDTFYVIESEEEGEKTIKDREIGILRLLRFGISYIYCTAAMLCLFIRDLTDTLHRTPRV